MPTLILRLFICKPPVFGNFSVLEWILSLGESNVTIRKFRGAGYECVVFGWWIRFAGGNGYGVFYYRI